MSEAKRLESFTFGSKEIRYELSFQERKTLGIKVYPNCKVKVIAPPATPEDNLRLKLREKAPWILKQQAEFLSYHPLTPPRKFVSGETHLYLGRQYRLKLESTDCNSVKLKFGLLLIQHKPNTSPKELLDQWYREKANIRFKEILEATLPLFRKYNISCPELNIRQMQNRWGSCTAKGKIILNPELIKAPKACIEYVVIHELCHLVHHNHTRLFYELQEQIMPDWGKWKERLENILT